MKYVIVGCGRVGSTLAKRLDRAGHQVTVIDENPSAFRRLGKNFPGRQVLGTGIDVDVLARAGAETADGLATVTEGDNRNIMAALIAQEHFKIKRVVARIYDPERSHMYRDFGVATICPTTVGARLMANALIDDAYRRLPFERPDVEVLEVRVGDHSAGKTVADLTVAGKTQVCVVIRREESLIPTPDLALQRDDRIVVVVQPDYLEQFRKSVETELARTA